MKNNKIMMMLLCCALLLGTVSGCGKKIEDTSQTAENQVASETAAPESISEETQTTAESKSKKETTDTTATTGESETAQTTTNESGTGETTTGATAVTTQTATVQTEAQQENPVSPEENNPPDVPAQVVQVTEAPVEVVAPDPDAQPATPAPVEETPSAVSMTISYQGNSLTIGESAKAFTDAVKPLSSEAAPSCYGDGENINYYYDGMTVYVWNKSDDFMIYSIDITAPGIAPVNGMDIGSPVTFDGEKMIDVGNGYNAIVLSVGGTVSSISYNKNLE